jgi:hypothetical protein
MLFEVTNYREVNRGALRGRFDIECRATGITLREWRHYKGERGETIQGPFQYLKRSGEKIRFHHFDNGEEFAKFEKQILHKIHQIGGRNSSEQEKTQ